MPLAESRGGASGGVWGNAPTVPRQTYSKEEVNKGAGSEASLPVTSRVLRRAPKLLYPSLAHCRVKWTRPRSWSFRHNRSFLQAGDFASAEATRGQWKRTKFAVAPLTPSRFAPPCCLACIAALLQAKLRYLTEMSHRAGKMSPDSMAVQSGAW